MGLSAHSHRRHHSSIDVTQNKENQEEVMQTPRRERVIKKVYDNGHCIVSVEMLPDSKVGAYWSMYPSDRSGAYLRPFATISVSARDSEKDIWVRHIHPSPPDKITVEKMGWFREDKIHTTPGPTPERALQDSVLAAVRYADEYKDKYLETISSATEALEGVTHQIDAVEEVNALLKDKSVDK